MNEPQILELTEQWTRLSKLMDSTRAMGNMNVHNRLSFQNQVEEFVRHWTVQAASGDDRLWKVLEQASASLRQKLDLMHQLAEQDVQKSRTHEQRQDQARAQLQRTQEETRQIRSRAAQSQREASDERHQEWMRVNFPERFCPLCSHQYLLPHRYCQHCHGAPGRFRSGF